MSIRFDGTGADNLNRAISFSADTGTIMFWTRIVTDRNAFTSFVNPRQTANQEVLIQTDVTGTLIGLWQANVMTTGTNLTVGQWYHLAIINSASACTVYLDGVQDITRAHAAGAVNWTQIYLGTNALATAEALNGNIGVIKAWNATLTLAEINAEKHRITPQRYANIVGWWPTFPGERTIDYSRQGNLTQVGTVTDEANPPVSWGGSPIIVLRGAAGGVTRDLESALSSDSTISAQFRRGRTFPAAMASQSALGASLGVKRTFPAVLVGASSIDVLVAARRPLVASTSATSVAAAVLARRAGFDVDLAAQSALAATLQRRAGLEPVLASSSAIDTTLALIDFDALYPDAVLASANLQDSALAAPPVLLSDLDDDPTSPDPQWFTAINPSLGIETRLAMPAPQGLLRGTQRVRVLFRRAS